MKLKLTLSLALFLNIVFGQIPVHSGQKKCNEKLTQRKGQRFTDWECGKIAGIIECNEYLSLDQETNTVFKKANDLQNLQEANKPFTGTCETCHPNGILERRVKFVNGKENGTDTAYYENGCPMAIRSHIQGVENGKWIFFHDTIVSMVAWEMNFFAGEKDGPYVKYNKKGDTTLLETYKNGILHGKKIKYFQNTKKERELNYKKGLLDGEFIIYTQDEKILEKINYKEGKRNGEATYFYSDGEKLLKTENWTMDVKNGEFKTFFAGGNLQSLETYVKGIKEGSFEEYFPNSKPKRVATYKKNILIEEIIYDEFGEVISVFPAKAIKVVEEKKAEDDEVISHGKKKNSKVVAKPLPKE